MSWSLAFVAFFCFAQSQKIKIDDKGCIWSYRCCNFTDVDGGTVKCSQLCEPEINCEKSEVSSEKQREVVEEEIQPMIATAAFSLNLNSVCRQGFRLDSEGKCRRVFKPATDRTTTKKSSIDE
jgi:hypothetical protein